MAQEEGQGENAALIAFAKEQLEPQWVDATDGGFGAPMVIVPEGMRLESVKRFADEYAKRPDRKAGTAMLTAEADFIAHVNRFKDGESAVFAKADPKAPSILAVIDYHESGEGGPRFGKHRSIYACPLSEEWQAWTGADGRPMSQAAFAEFLEDRIADLVAPPQLSDAADDAKLQETAAMLGGRFNQPSALMELSRGIQVDSSEKVHQAVNLATGEIEIRYANDHGEVGRRLSVNNLFLVCIPVFRNGPLYRLVGRLRYRLKDGQITWSFNLWRADKVFEHAFEEICGRVAAETQLPVFRGSPEA
jgi:uncharacterized protein YfdQ (DUF2303 family)